MAKGEAPHVREAREDDLPAVAAMIDAFAVGHKSEHHVRSVEKLRAAYFGPSRVAELLVAERGRVVGMVQWSRFFDQFWSAFGAQPEWMYVVPEARGWGIAAMLIADVCARARRAGAEFVRGGALTEDVAKLYERVAIGSPSYECFVSASAFHALADLAGKPVREIVRGLPDPALNRVAR